MCSGDSRTANVVATIKNKGPVLADLSKIPWNIAVEAQAWWTTGGGSQPNLPIKAQWGGPAVLQPGETAQATLAITNIRYPVYASRDSQPQQATLGVKIVVDPTNGVNEGAREGNNVKLLYLKQNRSDCPN